MPLPLVDLKKQYLAIRDEIEAAIEEVVQTTAFINGPAVGAFEESFAGYLGAGHAIGVGNGTDALALALQALGIGPGDEVVVPALTFVATSEAVTMTGARPVFADVDRNSGLIDLEQAGSVLTPQTRAIIPVHLYGQACDMQAVMAFASARDLFVVEDAAQAHGARLNGESVGTIGQAGCFSFYPGKNLGAYGDGGAVVTDDAGVARMVRMLANHGRIGKFDHEFEGVNSRLDTLQAAILKVKLQHLDRWNKARRRWAGCYRESLQDISELSLPAGPEAEENVFHVYVVRAVERDGLRAHLRENGIGAGIHYPAPCPLLPAYAHLGHRAGDFPAAEALCSEILSLPLFPELEEADIEQVATTIKAFYSAR